MGTDVVRTPTLVSLNEVGMLLRDVRRPETEPLETRRLDQTPGRVVDRIGEDRSRIGTSGFMKPPPADDGRYLGSFVFDVTRSHLELGLHHNLRRQ